MRKSLAFTLIEMIVAVAIVIILTMLVVPNVLRSRIVANEGAALSNLKSINNACQLFHINNDIYPDDLSNLTEPAVSPPYLDEVLSSGQKQGYEFIYALVDDGQGFEVNANPTGVLKGRYFYMDQTGVIRAAEGGPASAEDEIVK